MSLGDPALNIDPIPDQRRLETGDRLREVLVSRSPHVNRVGV